MESSAIGQNTQTDDPPSQCPGQQVEATTKIPEVSFRLDLDGKQTGNRALISPSGSSSGTGQQSGTMQKCLSFPRIVTDRPTTWSISPCQSRTYLDACYPQSFLGGSEKSMDPDRLSIAGHAGLLRSMSARTVDLERRAEPENSVNSSGSSSRYLSPAGDRIDPLAGRSTSCPSMAYVDISYSKSEGLPPGTSNDVRRMLFRNNEPEEDDIDLAGEEIDDLPIEPNTVFPELPPDLISGPCRSEAGNLSLRNLHISDDHEKASSETVATTTNKSKIRNANEKKNGAKTDMDYVNVRDLPKSTLSDAMKRRPPAFDTSSQNVDTNQKCLSWLNALPVPRS